MLMILMMFLLTFFLGKTSIIRYLSKLSGCPIAEITLTETIDSTELLGTFEPQDTNEVQNTLQTCMEVICNKMAVLQILAITQQEDGSQKFISSCRQSRIKLIVDTGFALLMNDVKSKTDILLWLKNTEKELEVDDDPQEQNEDGDGFTRTMKVIADIKTEIQRQAVAIRRLVTLMISINPDMMNPELESTIASASSEDKQHLPLSSTTFFRWNDGQLLQSIERGDWVVLRHIHYASPAVLDRLNSLLEPNGKKNNKK